MGILRVAAIGVFGAFVLIVPAIRADRIVVRNGSLVKGKAIVDEAHPDRYLIFGEKGKTPLVLKRDRIERIEPEPGPLDAYAVRRRAMPYPPTPGDEYDLGAWCEAARLPDLAALHFEAAVRRDPTFAPAHAKLGHVLKGDRWLTPVELKAAQGFILFHGKWITPEEKEQRDSEASASAEQKSWSRRVAALRAAIVGGSDARSREAEAALLEIRETAAIPAIARVFGADDEPEVRKLAARALAGIGGPEASAALVRRVLAEPDETVRNAAMEALLRSKEPGVIPSLVKALKSPSVPVINRAAWALAILNAVPSAPSLVPALVTTEYQVVWVNTGDQGGGGYGLNGGMPAGGFGVSGGRSIPVLTGPTVGPGVVAFGATSVPASAFNGAGLGVGSSTRGPIPTYVPVTRRNTEVLSALVRLTGKDFGYDVTAWRRWFSTAFRPEAVPVKRVPQP